MESFIKKISGCRSTALLEQFFWGTLLVNALRNVPTQLTFTYSNSTTKALEKDAKYVKT